MPLSADDRRALSDLWAEIGPKSARKFWERARREGIGARWTDVEAFVQAIPDRATEQFTFPRQTGKAFVRGPHAEWKVDLLAFAKPSKNGNSYILLRVNSFSREADGLPLATKTQEETARGFETLLRRAAHPPEVVLTDLGTEWGGPFSRLLEREGIDHMDKHPADHGSFAVIDSAIRTIKLEMAVRRRDGLDWEEAFQVALREFNSDPNPTTGTAPKNVEGNKEAEFFIMKQNAQNLQHNLRETQKREAKIEREGAIRPLILGTEEQDRRKGPRERIDDPRWGEQERIVEGPGAFAFGLAHTAQRHGERPLPLKLTKPTRMAEPDPLTPEEIDSLRHRLEPYMTRLFERILEVGPLSIADAMEYLQDEGLNLRAFKGRFRDIAREFSDFFQIDRGMVLVRFEGPLEGVPVRIDQARPRRPKPVAVRGLDREPYSLPLHLGELDKPGLLERLRRTDAEVHRALNKKQPSGLGLVRRMARWLQRNPDPDDLEDFLHRVHLRIVGGELTRDPLGAAVVQASPTPPPVALGARGEVVAVDSAPGTPSTAAPDDEDWMPRRRLSRAPSAATLPSDAVEPPSPRVRRRLVTFGEAEARRARMTRAIAAGRQGTLDAFRRAG